MAAWEGLVAKEQRNVEAARVNGREHRRLKAEYGEWMDAYAHVYKGWKRDPSYPLGEAMLVAMPPPLPELQTPEGQPRTASMASVYGRDGDSPLGLGVLSSPASHGSRTTPPSSELQTRSSLGSKSSPLGREYAIRRHRAWQ